MCGGLLVTCAGGVFLLSTSADIVTCTVVVVAEAVAEVVCVCGGGV